MSSLLILICFMLRELQCLEECIIISTTVQWPVADISRPWQIIRKVCHCNMFLKLIVYDSLGSVFGCVSDYILINVVLLSFMFSRSVLIEFENYCS